MEIMTIASGILMQAELIAVRITAGELLDVQEPEGKTGRGMAPVHAEHGHGYHPRDRQAPWRDTSGGGCSIVRNCNRQRHFCTAADTGTQGRPS